MKFSLSSPAFEMGEPTPVKYTCDGDNISPPLTWNNPPENTRSFVLVVDDPDAPGGTWTHWLLYNIPPSMNRLPENFAMGGQIVLEGRNSFNHVKYDGACPPIGSTHMYHFNLFALDQMLDLPAGVTRDQVFEQIQDHIIDNAELTGSYARQEARTAR
jgi:Raf kinase inhibitor-like YbhB/YbcL family protein